MSTPVEKVIYLNETKDAIREAIIAKGVEVAEDATFRSYADSIGAIESPLPQQEKTIEITANGSYEVTPDEGLVISKVTAAVNVPIPEPVIEELTITANGTYPITEGIDGFGPVNVNVPGPVIEALEITENGTYEVAAGVDGYNPITVNVPTGGGGEELPEEGYKIGGNCTYRFAYNGWNWYIDAFENKVTTEEINNATSMFYNSDQLTEIPFDINLSSSCKDIKGVFSGCNKLKTLPKIQCTPITPTSNSNMPNFDGIFYYCCSIREIPDDYFSFLPENYAELRETYKVQGIDALCQNMYSLRKAPSKNILKLLKNYYSTSYMYAMYPSLFSGCSSLDEITDLLIDGMNYTSNAFSSTFSNCTRLKRITFETNEDGSAKIANWKGQTITLTGRLGTATTTDKNNILNYNSGITADKEVRTDEQYAALKNDPDWFATLESYSRYNHDSAVETINSLPDTSAFLAANGGTNTIKFQSGAGSNTDGGAINTLTEAEIAVAAAKGWTVTLS